MNEFDRAFTQLLEVEKGYSNHKLDPGGKTKYGITERVARINGYTGDMKDLPIYLAKTIYRNTYWQPYLNDLPYSLAYNIFDMSVNSGNIQANKLLQKVLNVKEDGVIGTETLKAINKVDLTKLTMQFNATRLLFLTNLSTWDTFGKGWARRIAINMQL